MEREKRSFGDKKPERGQTPSREKRPRKDFSRSDRDSNSEGKARTFDNRSSSYDQKRGRSKVVNFNSESRNSYDEPRRERSFERRDDNRGGSRDYQRRDYDKGNGKVIERKGGDRPYERRDNDRPYERRGDQRGNYSKPNRESRKPDDGLIRLNKYIANSGVCSRRDADVLIAAGAVTVNGKTITEMGHKVSPEDIVIYGGDRLYNEKKRYLLLNKPKGYITTSDDPQKRKTVMTLIHGACKERIYPVGRLDRNTTGLLLFTNDGDVAKKLTHPSFGARKIYHVETDKNVTQADLTRLVEGIELEDGFTVVDQAHYVGDGEDKKKIGIEIHSGKNRVVRRLFEYLDYEVIKLDRVSFAGLTKKELPKGNYRFLSEKEIGFLKMLKGN